MRLQYNSPVILTFTIISAVVVFFTGSSSGEPMSIDGLQAWFAVGGPLVSFGNPLTWPRLFTHVLGHAGWEHYIGNFMLILLIGPILEEKYGSKDLLFMILFTAAITGILQIILFPGQVLLGASGVVFMLIILGSITNYQAGKIPITFILVMILYIGKEVFASFGADQVSQFAHIIGGICGAVFGFVIEGGLKKKS